MTIVATSYTPTTAYAGQQITVTGTGINTVVNVLVSNIPAAIVGTPTTTSLTFIVPNGVPVGTGQIVRLLDNTTGDVPLSPNLTTTAVSSDTGSPLTPVLATVWRLDANAGTYASPNWLQVRGLTAFDPALTPNTFDASTFDTGLYGATGVGSLAWQLSGSALRGKGVVTGAYDPGQEILRNGLLNVATAAGQVDVQWYDRSGGPEAFRAYGLVTAFTESGGGFGSPRTVSWTLSINGAATVIQNPVINNPALRGGF